MVGRRADKSIHGTPPTVTPKVVERQAPWKSWASFTKILTKSRKVKSRIAARDLAQRQRTPFKRNRVAEKTVRSKENLKRNQSTKEDKDDLKHIDPNIIAMANDVLRLNKLIYRILNPDSPSNDGHVKAG